MVETCQAAGFDERQLGTSLLILLDRASNFQSHGARFVPLAYFFFRFRPLSGDSIFVAQTCSTIQGSKIDKIDSYKDENKTMGLEIERAIQKNKYVLLWIKKQWPQDP